MIKSFKIKYHNANFDPKKLDKQNIDRLAIDSVPPKSLVLDVGCATGFMGEYLIKEKECKVYGVEMRRKEALIAKKKLNGVIVVDVEEDQGFRDILKLANNRKFDVVLGTSVIEHLKNPDLFISNCKKLIKPDGILIMSTPNIAHWTMRLSLLKGRFDYSEYGILDNTHLHLFTLKTFRQLFEENGYKVRHLLIDPVGGGYPKISRVLAKLFPELFGYQILIVAQNSLYEN